MTKKWPFLLSWPPTKPCNPKPWGEYVRRGPGKDTMTCHQNYEKCEDRTLHAEAHSHCTGHGAQEEVSSGKRYQEVRGVGKRWVMWGMQALVRPSGLIASATGHRRDCGKGEPWLDLPGEFPSILQVVTLSIHAILGSEISVERDRASSHMHTLVN